MSSVFNIDKHANRIDWIDCVRFIVIIAVAADHCYCVLYMHPAIAQICGTALL